MAGDAKMNRNVVELGGIKVNEAEAIAKALEEGRYNIIKAAGDWTWLIWIATGESEPVFIEYNKGSGFVRVYRQSHVKEIEKVERALEAAWNEWETHRREKNHAK